ncbi:PREDICTED: DNA translocase FtsK-like [Rhagoletis zephyria]|uniref:DNA translocase FtsK-like n=1 Tax=Rhagoletis zephyria TaxID=28612 RepID=UPI00081134A2|nr:PREDICTED: DNA translocase FtsK-like [Rhagoletis zephyria]
MFHKSAFLLLVLAIALAIAEPPRFLSRPNRFQQRRPFLARQQSVPAAPQPEFAAYPSADELKPENPFQVEEETSEPDLVYGPPDATYGPPLPATDPLPAVESPPQFATNPDAEEFERLTQSRPSSRVQQRPQQQRAQVHLVQRTQHPQRLQQRNRQQNAVVKQVVNAPQRQKATIKRVVSTQQFVARPAPALAAAVVVAAPIAAVASTAVAPAKVVISSERLVAVEPAPAFSAAVSTPLGESYVVINSPFALTSQFQSW